MVGQGRSEQAGETQVFRAGLLLTPGTPIFARVLEERAERGNCRGYAGATIQRKPCVSSSLEASRLVRKGRTQTLVFKAPPKRLAPDTGPP